MSDENKTGWTSHGLGPIGAIEGVDMENVKLKARAFEFFLEQMKDVPADEMLAFVESYVAWLCRPGLSRPSDGLADLAERITGIEQSLPVALGMIFQRLDRLESDAEPGAGVEGASGEPGGIPAEPALEPNLGGAAPTQAQPDGPVSSPGLDTQDEAGPEDAPNPAPAEGESPSPDSDGGPLQSVPDACGPERAAAQIGAQEPYVNQRTRIIDFLTRVATPVTQHTLLEQTGIPRASAASMITRMVTDNIVRRNGRGPDCLLSLVANEPPIRAPAERIHYPPLPPRPREEDHVVTPAFGAANQPRTCRCGSLFRPEIATQVDCRPCRLKKFNNQHPELV